MWTKKNQWKSFNLSSIAVRRPNYPFNCFTLDLNDDESIKTSGVKQLFLYFNRRENTSVKVLIEDKSLSCSREIKYHKFYFSGPNVELKDLGIN